MSDIIVYQGFTSLFFSEIYRQGCIRFSFADVRDIENRHLIYYLRI